MTRERALVLGAVAYDAKVVTIWEGFVAWFAEQGLDVDFVLFSNYERQVEAQFAGLVDVAWNSPLAWVESERLATKRGRTCTAIAMRDTDRDLRSLVIARADSDVRALADLKGRVVAVGASDSPQATLIPLLHLAEAGLEPGRDVRLLRHDVLVGKHGDHVGGERDAVRALLAGEADAACLIDGNHLAFTREGTLAPGATRILSRTAPYDHCNFTVLDGAPAAAVERLRTLLTNMSYEDPRVRALMDLEGLKAWKPGRTTGYDQLTRAVARFGTIEAWLARAAS
jgi:ABC-type phosphate/phosphonate transport system substrate-binding protein